MTVSTDWANDWGKTRLKTQIVLKLSENDVGSGHGVTNSAPNVRCCPNPQEHGPPLRVSKRSSQTQPLFETGCGAQLAIGPAAVKLAIGAPELAIGTHGARTRNWACRLGRPFVHKGEVEFAIKLNVDLAG